jgi:hypothetical protein
MAAESCSNSQPATYFTVLTNGQRDLWTENWMYEYDNQIAGLASACVTKCTPSGANGTSWLIGLAMTLNLITRSGYPVQVVGIRVRSNLSQIDDYIEVKQPIYTIQREVSYQLRGGRRPGLSLSVLRTTSRSTALLRIPLSSHRVCSWMFFWMHIADMYRMSLTT